MSRWMHAQEDHRRRLFSLANQARSKGRAPRAVLLFRELLDEEPGDIDVILRLAPLLAHEGEHFEAWSLYRQACKSLLKDGRNEACLAAFREANRVLPYEFEGWRLAAELERKLGREREAFETLLEGRRQFRSRFVRAQAIALLELAREIHAWEHVVVIDLAQLYLQSGRTMQALRLLDGALVHAAPSQLAEVRLAQLHATRSPRHLALWLKQVFRRTGSPDAARLEAEADDRTWCARVP